MAVATAGCTLVEKTPREVGENGYFAQFGFHNR
jgi:hypothetical protein